MDDKHAQRLMGEYCGDTKLLHKLLREHAAALKEIAIWRRCGKRDMEEKLRFICPNDLPYVPQGHVADGDEVLSARRTATLAYKQ